MPGNYSETLWSSAIWLAAMTVTMTRDCDRDWNFHPGRAIMMGRMQACVTFRILGLHDPESNLDLPGEVS